MPPLLPLSGPYKWATSKYELCDYPLLQLFQQFREFCALRNPSLLLPTLEELAMDVAAKGDVALAESNYALAIQHFTHALTELPRAAAYYISRSTAYSRLKPEDGGPNYQAALNDAEVALRLAYDRGSRDLMISAQLRRAVSLYQLNRFGDAAYLLELLETKVNSLSEVHDKASAAMAAMPQSSGPRIQSNHHASLPIWLTKIRTKRAQMTDGDEWSVTVQEDPTGVHVPSVALLKAQLAAVTTGHTATDNSQAVDSQASAAGVPTAPDQGDSAMDTTPDLVGQTVNASATAASTPTENIHHEWYQTRDNVVVVLYAKGIDKDRVTVDVKETSISVRFPLPSGAQYELTLDPLWGTTDPDDYSYRVKATKIEVTLSKMTLGKWGGLKAPSGGEAKARDKAPIKDESSHIPVYPTSSRNGPKNWDKVVNDLTEETTSNPGSKAKGSGGSDGENGDDVDGFFKQLYANSDDATRRAMVKSFTESQGTTLSTNWADVGKGKVEPHK